MFPELSDKTANIENVWLSFLFSFTVCLCLRVNKFHGKYWRSHPASPFSTKTFDVFYRQRRKRHQWHRTHLLWGFLGDIRSGILNLSVHFEDTLYWKRVFWTLFVKLWLNFDVAIPIGHFFLKVEALFSLVCRFHTSLSLSLSWDQSSIKGISVCINFGIGGAHFQEAKFSKNDWIVTQNY